MMRKFEGINGFFNVAVMNSYLRKINKINAPLMPGKIMAQMAMIPHRNINHNASGVATGIILTMMVAAAIPATKPIPPLPNQFFTCLPTTNMEAAIRPKKRLQVGTG